MKRISALILLMPILLAADDWIPLLAAEQGFSVEFPAAYERSVDEGFPEPCEFYYCIDGDFSYTLSCMPNPFPDIDLREQIEDFTDEMLDVFDIWARVEKKRFIKLEGYPGVELQMVIWLGEDTPEMGVTQRSYIASGRFYTLGVAYPTDKKDRKAIRKFFRSFKLLE